MTLETNARVALGSFSEFVLGTPSEALPLGTPPALSDYIRAWVEAGEGIRATRGDFEKYLIAVVTIIDYWVRNPGSTDYLEEVEVETEEHDIGDLREHPRRVSAIFRDDDQGRYILDRDFYTEWAFRTLHLKNL